MSVGNSHDLCLNIADLREEHLLHCLKQDGNVLLDDVDVHYRALQDLDLLHLDDLDGLLNVDELQLVETAVEVAGAEEVIEGTERRDSAPVVERERRDGVVRQRDDLGRSLECMQLAPDGRERADVSPLGLLS